MADDLVSFLRVRLGEQVVSALALSEGRRFRMAELDAMHKIIDEHRSSGDEYGTPHCLVCQWDICCDAPKADYHRGAGEFPCRTLRLLAAPHSGHPDYRAEEWRP